MTHPDPQDSKESRDNAPFVAFGIIRASLGLVVFAVTQYAVWLGIGPGIGIVVGAALQANRR